MYTEEIKIGEDGRPINSGLCRLSAEQASALRAGATRGAGESKGSTTQARPRVNEYECGKASPSPDLGTAAGSCEPTTPPSTIRSRAPDPEDSNVETGQSVEKKVTRSGSKDTRATRSRPSHTTPT
jgi:hypothetical protein